MNIKCEKNKRDLKPFIPILTLSALGSKALTVFLPMLVLGNQP